MPTELHAQCLHVPCSVFLDLLEPVSVLRYRPPPVCRSAQDGCMVLGPWVWTDSLVFFSNSLDVYQHGWIYASGHCSVSQGQWMPVGDPATFRKLKQRNGQLLLFGASGEMNREAFYQSQEYLVFAT